MASLRIEYREKRIIILSSPNSATSQFTHNGMVYSQKMKGLDGNGNSKALLAQLFKEACKRVDKILGPERAEHLLKT